VDVISLVPGWGDALGDLLDRKPASNGAVALIALGFLAPAISTPRPAISLIIALRIGFRLRESPASFSASSTAANRRRSSFHGGLGVGLVVNAPQPRGR
jgi:hypothetical protein